MRVFSFRESRAVRTGPLLVTCALALAPTGARGQWPTELEVRVRDGVTGAPVSGARIDVLDQARTAWASPQGEAVLRGVRAGSGRLSVSAYGYEPAETAFAARNGARVLVDVTLSPAPVALDGIETRAAGRTESAGTVRLSRESISTSTATTVGEALAALPGVVLRRDHPGGAETVSVRGSATDAVLVLVDGVPLNDPLTGVADLSRVPLASVREIVVHRGAASASFGSRARAGAIEVRTGPAPDGLRLRVGGGSLGNRSAGLAAAGRTGETTVSGGLAAARAHGRFAYTLPDAAGGRSGQRANADAESLAGWAGLDAAQVSARASADWTHRGLPGAAYNPTRRARQTDWGLQMSLGSGRRGDRVHLDGSAFGAFRSNRFADPAPPAGLAYDETARVRELGGSVRASAFGSELGVLEIGVDGRTLAVTATALDRDAPRSAVHVGAFAGATLSPAARWPLLGARVRVDRDGWTSRWHATHALRAGLQRGALAIDLTHRSAFSPPTLADQFFAEGVAVRPNPALRAERTPSEVELSVRYGAGAWRGGASLYAGDVTDLIVWQPDFRFVWSPSNADVRRGGAELWGELRGRGRPWRIFGSYAHARVRYDRADGDDSVQVAYRPRNTAALTAEWSGPRLSGSLGGHYVGRRFPVPAPVNHLPGFWSWDAEVGLRSALATWSVETRLRIRRLLDQRQTLIFDFPDPGRTLELEIELSPAGKTRVPR